MSERNVELVRLSNEAFNRGDVEAMIGFSDPDIEIEDLPDLPESKVFRGHDGLREFLALNLEPWRSFIYEIERLIDLGDSVVMLGRNVVRGSVSGVELEQGRGAVFTVREDKIVSVRFYADQSQALEAAGLDRQLTQR